MLKEYTFKEGETGLYIPMGTSGHVGGDVPHKLYTLSAKTCVIIAGVNAKAKEGFLAHVSGFHGFSENAGESLPDAEFGRTVQQLKEFHANGGKISLIASAHTEDYLLAEVKDFLDSNKISYETIKTGREKVSVVVDHQAGEIKALRAESKKPSINPNLAGTANILGMLKGGIIARHAQGKTEILDNYMIASL